MNITLAPSPVGGLVSAPPSKSDAHRRLICAALSSEPSDIRLDSLSRDIEATASCLRALGSALSYDGRVVSLSPLSPPPSPLLDCVESGSTLRFMLPVAAAVCDASRFSGQGRLPQRPIGHLLDAMERHGVRFSAEHLPFELCGRLSPGLFRLPGDVSSQYVSGLLMALPRLRGDSELVLTSPLQSSGYVDMTLAVLRDFGVRVEERESGWLIPGGQAFHSPGSVSVEGDWSNSAFFLCAGAISQSVSVTGLSLSSTQGDKAVLDILSRMGAVVSLSRDKLSVSPAPLSGCDIDMRHIPDLLPVLAVTAACAQGKTRFLNAARLREKESDRLSATCALLRALGGNAEELPDGLVVSGPGLTGGTVDGCNDHRIVMAAAVAAAVCKEPVKIIGAEAVAKSFPDFFRRYSTLGALVHEE